MARKSSPVSVLGGFFIVLTWLIIFEGVSSSSCQSLPCLYYGNGNTLKAIEINSSKVHTVLTNLNSIKAVDVHVKLNLVYWSETRPNAIKRLNVSSGKVEDILTDSNLGEIDGLAVEWESDLIYWTDYTNERIEVAQLDGKNRRTLTTGRVPRPREIAVDPRKGYMFWISRGFQPRIERATLSGDSKTTLVSFSFSWWLSNRPNGITLDFSSNRLYWVDTGTGRIESIDFNGNTRERFKTLPFSSQPYDIVLYSGVFYYSDTSSQSIGKIDKATKQSLGSYTGLGASNDLRLAMFSPIRQPKGSTACHNNGGCSHFCLLSPAGNQCACPPGEILKSDGKTCDDQGSSIRLLFADRTQQELYQIPLWPDSSVSTTATALPLSAVRSPQGVDFDPVMKYVYWSDGSRDEIFRALLNGSAQEMVVDQLGTPDGIAVDSVGRNLYWTDRTSNRIEVAKLDGSFRKTLVYENLYDPLDIVLDMENGYMYWSEGASGFNNPKIERADMDGTNRKVIITLGFSFFRSPNGLALDKEHNRLYYVVGRSSEISFVSLSTNTRSTFLTRSSFSYPKGVALHENYIYWTEGLGQSGAVYRADRVSGGNVKRIVDNLRGPEDICVYDANDTTQTVNSSCGINNGGCSHLCLLTPRGHQCACPNEMKLKTDKKNCHFSEFLLYADSSRRKIFLINLDHTQAQSTAVKLGNTLRPEALDYDPQERFIYWSDLQLRQILRVQPDGSAKEIIINNGLQSPKGLAVDHVGRNLYWTDFDANRIEVSKLNGSYRKILISQNIQRPMDIVLDLKNGLMYWSSWSNTQPTIERASMDGSMRKTLVQFSSSFWQPLARPNGLALDPENRRLYWVDTGNSVIQYTELQQGNGAKVTLRVGSRYLSQPYGLALKENTLYWSTSGSIYSADKVSGGNVRRLAGIVSSPRDVHVYHNYTGIPDNHPCTLVNGWCTHLCLLKPGGYQCACPANAAVGVSCKTTPVFPSSTVSPSPSPLPSPSPSPSPSLSPSPLLSPSPSPSSSLSPSPLPTPSPSPSPSPQPSPLPSPSSPPSLSSPFPSSSLFPSPSSSPYSSSPSPSPSPSPLPSPSPSLSSSSSPSSSPSSSRHSPSPPSPSPSSPSPFPSPSPPSFPSLSLSPSPSSSPSLALSSSSPSSPPSLLSPPPSSSPLSSPSPSPSPTPAPSPSPSPSSSPSPLPSFSPLPSPSSSPSSLSLSSFSRSLSHAPSLSSTLLKAPLFSRSQKRHVSSSSITATQKNPQGKPPSSTSLSETTMSPRPSPSVSSKMLFASSATLPSSRDPCISNPCQNGGTCVKGKQGAFTCRCPMMYKLSRCQLFVGDNVVNITFKTTVDQWKDDVLRKSISRAFTKYCSDKSSCNLRHSPEERTTLRRREVIASGVFRPDDVLVVSSYAEADKPGLFTVVAAVLIPLDEPQSTAERETIPAVIICRMVVKTSERISEYMGSDTSIELINGENDPPCVSESERNDDNTNTAKRTQAADRQQEKLSSGGVAGTVAGTLIFLMIIIVVALLFYRSRRRPLRDTLVPSFNNPGFEPRDLNNDDSDAAPFTIPDYEEISPIVVSSERGYRSQRRSSSVREKDSLYAEVGPSRETKMMETRDYQHDGETHLRQASDQAFGRTHRGNGRLPSQIHSDIANHHGRKHRNQIAVSNPTYEALPLEFECKPENGKINTSSNKKDRRNIAALENSSTGDYSTLAKREFHKDAFKREEPHYLKPPRKVLVPDSTLKSPADDGRNNTFYSTLGMSRAQTSNCNEFDGYAQLDPSRLLNIGSRQDPRRSRSSRDQSRNVNSVHPKLDNHEPKGGGAFYESDAEDNRSYFGKGDTAMKEDQSRSSEARAFGHLHTAEECMEYENQSYGYTRNNQKAWDVNPTADVSSDGNATESSRSRPSKASGQLVSPDEQITGENYLREQSRNNQEDQNNNRSSNGEAAVLYLTTEHGPDEATI